MKKVTVISILIMFSTSVMYAQSTPNSGKTEVKPGSGQTPVKKGETLRQIPPTPPPSTAPAPPPAPRNTTPPPPVAKSDGSSGANAPIYKLTSVRVRIRTGNDNKEFPSGVVVGLMPKNITIYNQRSFSQDKLSNEMRVNAETEFGLERDETYIGDTKLEAFQSSGVRLQIFYHPNFFTDAWKIESVSIVLEFKDQFGNLHPTLGSKTIVFSNAYGFLNGTYRSMECTADGSFVPITAIIK